MNGRDRIGGADRLLQMERTAEGHLRSGNIGVGIDCYLELLASDPDRPNAWYNLGYLQRCARQFEAALRSYANALDHRVMRPEEVHVNMAAILTEHLNRPDEAREHLLAATQLNQEFVPAWLNLGQHYEDTGDTASAMAAYQRVTEIDPSNGRAIGRLAVIESYEAGAQLAIERLSTALPYIPVGTADWAEAQFALGHALDQAGRYDEAYRAIQEANEVSKRLQPPQARFDRTRHSNLIDDLIRTFPLPSAPIQIAEGVTPIFVCGLFRSGSTLIEDLLARRCMIFAAGELELIPAFVAEHSPYPTSSVSLGRSHFEEARDNYIAHLRRIGFKSGSFTDKRPDNFLHIGLIKSIFPNAKFIHTCRNPIDNILSIYFMNFDKSISYGCDLSDISFYYNQYRRVMHHWEDCYGNDILNFDYDRLVHEPEVVMAELLRFLDFDEVDTPIQPNITARVIKTPSNWQVRQPLHTRSSGRRFNYPAQSALIQALLEAA